MLDRLEAATRRQSIIDALVWARDDTLEYFPQDGVLVFAINAALRIAQGIPYEEDYPE
jgi:hypothetical protein